MDGMINHAIESFLKSSYGNAFWNDTLCRARVEPQGFLSMSGPKLGATSRVLNAAAISLGKPVHELLEDLGAWLVRVEPIRRLLRFGGRDFGDFVLSLEELPGRARMILPDLALEELQVSQDEMGDYVIGAKGMPRGWIWAIAGALRGMADDYGTLALISVDGCTITLSIALVEHAASRPFDLAPDHPPGQAA
ncbi:heme NO-binding domain-containing protein [Paracoccus shanxieyensis]|uniref:Heme NO-binding protein n=1 Tax=Paracoccus shanxieyensis TaxID=2675752 RepID=A0A6L6J206_9RHOB|nr:heme NO-binding domain-containing protein [Paracoccus shanxieyensis]MTH64804.1 heme NO-binding protein [Paracoccus shanxieyensis]MTH87963.1 heme NO-binding protein [Paracoccus shanxieyensis]